ncbi:hypothetical protein Pd630_LPD01141 [Rhodococcus opacus PD630]|nr:hypothetical protein Pd630_LPD01141 [Rhodococcus opacus PD630]
MAGSGNRRRRGGHVVYSLMVERERWKSLGVCVIHSRESAMAVCAG